MKNEKQLTEELKSLMEREFHEYDCVMLLLDIFEYMINNIDVFSYIVMNEKIPESKKDNIFDHLKKIVRKLNK